MPLGHNLTSCVTDLSSKGPAMFSRALAILAAVFAVCLVTNLTAQEEGAKRKGDKAAQAQAERQAQNREKLKGLLAEQRAFVKKQFDAWKNTVLTQRKAVRELATSPFADLRGKEAARQKLARSDFGDSNGQLQQYKWAHRLLTAELELAQTKADRVAVHEAHLLRMKQMEEECKKGPNAVEAAFQRLQAQIMLEREKAR
jgi:hypothetical protein